MDSMDVSIIWLNYNSKPILDLAKRSLESVLTLDYPSYETIIVDNASTDGSDQDLLSIVDKEKNVSFLKLRTNLGYAGGMSEGFKHAKGRYVAFITNDVVIERMSLRQALKYLESENAACVGGYLLNPLGRIYSAGNWIDALMRVGSVCGGLSESECNTLHMTWPVSYIDGAYIICNAEVIRREIELPFIPETFAYLDDNLLSFKLWNLGYRVLYVPVFFGTHYISQTFERLGIINRLSIKSTLVRLLVIKSCKDFIKKIYLKKILLKKYIRNVYNEAVETANIIKAKFGILDLNYIPHVHFGDETLIATMPFYRSIKLKFKTHNIVMHNFLTTHR
jgi:GT2 family glycosyltransferase